MRRWERSTHVRLCGKCGAEIHRWDPVFVIELQAITTPKVRCEACEGPAPPDLPALMERAGIQPSPMTHVSAGGFDFKRAQSGDEEDPA